jgi:hypothetical protein
LLFRGGRHTRIHQQLDALLRLRVVRRVFGHQKFGDATQGALLITRGNTGLHSVRAVRGTEDRITVIFAHDLPCAGLEGKALNDYLYANTAVSAGDPNYAYRGRSSTSRERDRRPTIAMSVSGAGPAPGDARPGRCSASV